MHAYRQQPMYRFLLVQSIASTIGLQTWMMLFNNFGVEMAGISGQQAGIIQSVREIPGFLALLVVFVLLVIREHRLSALSVLLLGTGVALAGFFPSYMGLMLTTLLMSFGFHYYETTNKSLVLQYFHQSHSPLVFGRIRSLTAIASIGAGLFIFTFDRWLSYQQLFLCLGLPVMVLGLWGLLQRPDREDLPPQHKKMILRRKYWLYYLLTFLAGARRQIFTAFSVFLMVKVFGFSLKEVTALFILNSLVNWQVNPLIGKAVVRFGERWVLSLEYFGLFFVFLTYAFSESKWLVGAMYIIDHILFNFAFAISTYFQKIGEPEDMAPTMAVGFTINHIAAVVLPALGGLLWMIDYRIPFIGAAILCLCSLLAVQWIPASLRKAGHTA